LAPVQGKRSYCYGLSNAQPNDLKIPKFLPLLWPNYLKCTREPHLVGEEVFNSHKRKVNVPLGYEAVLYQPDKVNFSHPRMATRFARAIHASCNLADVVEDLSLNLQEDHVPNNLRTTVEVCRPSHVIAIQETTCDELQYHIERLSKACFA
jgi:hypothetical protein